MNHTSWGPIQIGDIFDIPEHDEIALFSTPVAEVPKQKGIRIWNSTSTLCVTSNMSEPNVSRTLKCLSDIVFSKIDKTSFRNRIPSPYDEPTFSPIPLRISSNDLFQLIQTIFSTAQLTNECAVMSLVYLERLLESCIDMKLTSHNVRSLVVTCLLMSSKVWDDTSMWNSDFSLIYPYFELDLINKWEVQFLKDVEFNVSVSASQYAKYYFIIRNEEILQIGELEGHSFLVPLDEQHSQMLQRYSSQKNNRPTFTSTGTFDKPLRAVLS